MILKKLIPFLILAIFALGACTDDVANVDSDDTAPPTVEPIDEDAVDSQELAPTLESNDVITDNVEEEEMVDEDAVTSEDIAPTLESNDVITDNVEEEEMTEEADDSEETDD